MRELTPVPVGGVFGRWVVLAKGSVGGDRSQRFVCRCECGTEREVKGASLRTGRSKSCGCLQRELHIARLSGAPSRNYRHGLTRTPTYRSWESMKRRCSDLNDIGWKNYGGRGVRVCERWESFEAFLADMGERPQGTTLDRIDNDGHYEPSNCRWATRREQRANQRPRVAA